MPFRMHVRFSILWRHTILLLLFCAGLTVLWTLPMLIVGYPYEMPGLLAVRNFAETGLFAFRDAIGRYPVPHLLLESGVPSPVDGRLYTMILAMLSQWIPGDAVIAWNALGALCMALACVAFWILTSRVFGIRTAWVSTVIVGLMPLYWQEASYLHLFQPAFLFLFLSFAAFVWLWRHSRSGAIIVSGLFFGLSVACKDVFLVFIPWLIISYLWMNRAVWRKSVTAVFLFLFCVGLIYFTPYIGDIRKYGYPVNWNLAHFWPGGDEIADMTYEHLYPDPYTYYFDREWFDAKMIEHVQNLSELEKLQEQKVLLAYEVIEPTVFRSVANGFWLFVNNIPPYFHQGTVGGAFLWIFIIVGAASLLRTRRTLFWWMIGLVISTEFIVRFILHYNRIHAADTAWALALLAAVGVGVVADSLSRRRRGWITCVMTLSIAFQLLQTNRLDLAHRYSRTIVPQTLAAGDAIRNLPQDAVVAVDRNPSPPSDLAYLGGRTIVPFTEGTLRHLLEEGQLRKAFETYDVTHILEYPEDLEKEILRRVPGIKKVPVVEQDRESTVPDRWIRYILHMVR